MTYSSTTSIFPSKWSEERWIKHMTQNYTKDLKIDPFIFHVPQTIKDTKPEAYTPQIVGLGPYHHFRREVQHMEFQKRDAVRSYIKRDEFKEFIDFVKKITTSHDQQQLHPSTHARDDEEEDPSMFEATVRSSYDSYLDLEGRTLSWIMVVDGIFLLHVVKDYYDQMVNKKGSVDPLTERYVQEILMLENQIPLKGLQQIKKALERSFAGVTDIGLYDKFNYLCVQNSPLKLSNDTDRKDEDFEKHILHQMYQLILDNDDDILDNDDDARSSTTSHDQGSDEGTEASVGRGLSENSNPPGRDSRRCCILDVLAKRTTSKVTSFFEQVRELVSPSEVDDFVRLVGHSMDSGLQQTRLSGVTIPSNVEKATKILHEVGKNSKLFLQSSSNPKQQKGLVMEIHIPTVSKLDKIVKMEFKATKGGLQSLFMDWPNKTLHLPVITLKANSEVVLRNLVAYELAIAEKAAGSTLKLTEYVDLMCGLIDTEKDVKLLKEKKIIEGDLGDDKIVAIFNGINKSMEKLDKESSEVQKFVIRANEEYAQICIVKAFDSFKKFLARSQDVMRQIFPLLVLILLALQNFCDIFGCRGSRGLRGYASASWDYSNSSPGARSSMGSDSQPNFLMMPRKILRYSSP